MLEVQKIVLHFYDDKGTNIKNKVVFPSGKGSEDLLPENPAVEVKVEKRHKRVKELFGRYVRREPIPEEDLTDIYDEIPKFTWPDIPVLLELAQSDKELKNMPKSGISSYLQWNGGLEGTVALWLIEGLRQKQVAAMRHIQGTNDKVTANGLPLNPICMKGNMALQECERSREIHQEVLELYRRWWRAVGRKTPGEAAIFCPLELSDIRWRGWQRWERWSDIEIFKKVTDAGVAGQRIIREVVHHEERQKYLPGKKVRTINYALKEPADQKGAFTKEMLEVQKIVLHFYDDKGTNIKDKVVFPSLKASEDLLPDSSNVQVDGKEGSGKAVDGALGEALFDIQNSDPCNFVKVNWFSGMHYKTARRLIKKDKLPLLHKMLEDKSCAPDWNKAALLIGFISDDPSSVPVLLKFFQRNDSWSWKSVGKSTGISRMSGKVSTLMWIGKIGGSEADSILREAVTKQGALRLASDWIDGDLVSGSKSYGNKENVVTLIRGRAAKGLAFSGNPKNIEIVKQLYAQEHAYCLKNKKVTRLYNGLVDAMSIQDFIAENGRESYLETFGESNRLDVIAPYITKYAWHLKATNNTNERGRLL